MIQVIEAVSEEKQKYSTSLFLAGGITNCPQWQAEVLESIKELDITVFNPRRIDFPIHDPTASKEQITWEYEKLRQATFVSFWFSKETLCPITLFELGAALERTEKLFIGVPYDYSHRQNVETQTKLRRPKLLIVYTLKQLSELIKFTFQADHTLRI
jgi:hypothetical protein